MVDLNVFRESLLSKCPVLEDVVEWQCDVAEFYDVDSMVAVNWAHITGDAEVLGPHGVDLLRRLVEGGVRTAIFTTTNARCVSLCQGEMIYQHKDAVLEERPVVSLLKRIGAHITDTCIPYETLGQPVLGEHVAWGDTGAVAYSNAVFGSRSNFESGPAALAAALTGWTPQYGFHLKDKRAPSVLVRLRGELRDVAEWGALGRFIGRRFPGYETVPLILLDSVDTSPSASQATLKQLAASLASYGSIGMFHVYGVTAESTWAYSVHDRSVDEDVVIETEKLLESHGALASGLDKDIDVVALTAPQLSLRELARVKGLLAGRAVHDNVDMIVTTSPSLYAVAKDDGLVDALSACGVSVIAGTCLYLMRLPELVRERGWVMLASDSAKLVNIAAGAGLEGVLVPTEVAVDMAVRGHL